MEPKRHLRIYDHRLVQLVQETGDPAIAARLAVTRSKVAAVLADHGAFSAPRGLLLAHAQVVERSTEKFRMSW